MEKYLLGLVTTLLLGLVGTMWFLADQIDGRMKRVESAIALIQAQQCKHYVKEQAVDGTYYIIGPYETAQMAEEVLQIEKQWDFNNLSIISDCECAN